jgi:hypothetical protein
MTCLKNIISAAAAFALFTSASAGLINVPRSLPFNYAGCVVSDRSNSQVPHFWGYNSSAMTINDCTSYCSSKAYPPPFPYTINNKLILILSADGMYRYAGYISPPFNPPTFLHL